MSRPAGGRCQLVRADITTLRVDGIVNAANELLAGGSGVDGAIHEAAGPGLAEECRRWVRENGRCLTGGAMLTGAYDLPCRWVIHAVGPIWRGGADGESILLARAYAASLEIARARGMASLAFPCLSAGAYGYPKEEAAEIAIRTVRGELSRAPGPVVTFCVFSEEQLRRYQRIMARG